MAVSTATASSQVRADRRRAVTASGTATGSAVRTCVGCRQRAAATELLRVVAVPGVDLKRAVIADPRRRAPGRGAWVHPRPECVAAAERRRAFGRALRVPEPIDSSAVAGYVADLSEGEKSSNEPSMKRQR